MARETFVRLTSLTSRYPTPTKLVS